MDITNYQKCADEILLRVANGLRGADGSVRPQSLLCAVGAVAGYSAQWDIRSEYVFGKGMPEEKVFNIVLDKQGNKYYFGELIDELIIQDKFSLWGFVGGAVNRLGQKLPDINDIMRYVSYTAGGELFGKVRSCDTGNLPEEYLCNLWKPLKNIAEKHAEKGKLHIIFGICAQKAIMNCASSYNPSECGRILLESGIFMARKDYNSVAK